MKLKEIFELEHTPIDLAPFIKRQPGRGMPPLRKSQLTIDRLIGSARRDLTTAVCGDASLIMMYKGKEGAVTSLEEIEEGDEWSITQVQGARGNGYRVTSGAYWQQAFAAHLKEYATHADACVKRITMPTLAFIKGNYEASRSVEITYRIMTNAMEMSLSAEENKYIVEVK